MPPMSVPIDVSAAVMIYDSNVHIILTEGNHVYFCHLNHLQEDINGPIYGENKFNRNIWFLNSNMALVN